MDASFMSRILNGSSNKGIHCLAAMAAIAACCIACPAAAAPVVANVTATQRDDTSGMVDIHYDLSGGVEPMTVSVIGSNDAGATWTITPAAQYLSGDVGASVTNGTGKHIVWNIRADQPGICWAQTRVRVRAAEEITITLPGDVPLVLVRIPAGSFLMGRYSGEQSSDANEDPQHTVTIAYDFYMGKYEVTQAQWLAVMGSWPGIEPSSEWGVGDSYPAYLLSWNDAQNFITALNNHITSTGQGAATMRLPSEAEWEYAYRAGTTTRFYFGDSLGCADDSCMDCVAGVLAGNRSDYMWYCANSGNSKSVGGKLPNAFGLYDMSGNLFEWCQDGWHANYAGAPTDGSAWVLPSDLLPVFRGGSCGNNASLCRAAFRFTSVPSVRSPNIGFRLTLVR